MKKLTIIILALFLSLFLFSTLCSAANTSVLEGFETRKPQTTTDVDKTWTIKFSQPILETSINQDDVFITDKFNEKIAYHLELSDDKTKIKVVPKNSYLVGEEYRLYITNNITSKSGNLLRKSIVMPFNVTEGRVTDTVGPDGGEVVFSDTGRLIIHPGTVNEDFEVEVTQVDPESALSQDPLPEDLEEAIEICDFSYSFDHKEPIILEFTYDPAVIPEGWDPQHILRGVLWDPDAGKWYSTPALIDKENNTASIEIWPRVRKSAISGEAAALHSGRGFWARAGLVVRGHLSLEKQTSDRFVVVYDKNQNVPHNDWREGSRDPGPIHMAKDLLDNLEKAWDFYSSGLGLETPRLTQSSWVQGGRFMAFLERSILESEYSGRLKYLSITPFVSDGKEELLFEAAHELFHLFQNRQTNIFNMNNNIWWTEATAEAAAGLAFTNSTGKCPQEAGRFDYQISRSYFVSPLHSPYAGRKYATAHFVNYLIHNEGVDTSILFRDIVRASDAYQSLKERIDLAEAYRNFAGYMFFSKNSPTVEDCPSRMSRLRNIFSDDDEVKVSFDLGADCTAGSVFFNVWKSKDMSVRTFEISTAENLGDEIFVDIYKVTGDNHRAAEKPAPTHTVSVSDEPAYVHIHDQESFYMLATNASDQDKTIDVTIKDVTGAHLSIDPPKVTGESNRYWSFDFIAEKIPENVETVSFNWDFGVGADGTGTALAEVKDGKAQLTNVGHQHPDGQEGETIEYTLTVSLKCEDTGLLLAEAEALITLKTKEAETKVSIGPYWNRDPRYILPEGVTEITHEFTASGHPPAEYRYEWDFGDGNTLSMEKEEGQLLEVSHMYRNLKAGDVFRPKVSLYCINTGELLADDTIRIRIIDDYDENDQENGVVYGEFSFRTKSFDKYRITGYSGRGGHITIPAEHEMIVFVRPETRPVSTVYTRVFKDKDLTGVTFSDTLESISFGAFKNNQIKKLTMPDNIDFIGGEAFQNNLIEELTLPENVRILSYAFQDNQLTRVVLPNIIQEMGWGVFKNNQISEIVFPSNDFYIPNETFRNNQLTRLDIPDTVTGIGRWAFQGNKLTRVNIPDSVSSIGNGAFQDNRLQEIDIPGGITRIEQSAFENNELTHVIIPDNITYIGLSAFRDNPLEKIIIPPSVTEIGNGAIPNRKNDPVTVYGVPGSYAEEFVNNSLFLDFKPIE